MQQLTYTAQEDAQTILLHNVDESDQNSFWLVFKVVTVDAVRVKSVLAECP